MKNYDPFDLRSIAGDLVEALQRVRDLQIAEMANAEILASQKAILILGGGIVGKNEAEREASARRLLEKETEELQKAKALLVGARADEEALRIIWETEKTLMRYEIAKAEREVK